jgi:transporter family-2 protein
MNWNLAFSLLSAGAGACIALQASANGMFRRNLDSPWYAAFFSITGTITTALLFMLIARPPAPSMEGIRSTQWWNWIGGPLGALIVLAGATIPERLGAAAFIAFVVAGQLLCSLFLDHFALMGLAEKPITWGKILGAIFVVIGVLCIKYL